MNALEEIQAAIEKLTEFSTYGIENADDDYEVTMHRTIAAQIGLLQAILHTHNLIPLPTDDFDVWPIPAYAQNLARAINGTRA